MELNYKQTKSPAGNIKPNLQKPRPIIKITDLSRLGF